MAKFVLTKDVADAAAFGTAAWDPVADAQPSGIIIVAKQNGDYATIAEGLAAAAAGDVVLVYPGDYAESSLTIPSPTPMMLAS